MQRYVLLSGSSHPRLAKGIADHLKVSLGQCLIGKFPDGEIFVEIGESVRGSDVFFVQSIALQPNLHLMELLIAIDALKRASARSIIPVIPYFGYARQDRRGMDRVPITGKLVADLLQVAGATRVLTMDLHAEQIQGFFNIPVDNLWARPVLVEEICKMGLQKVMVVAPDAGSAKIARDYAVALKTDYGIVDKRRVSAHEVEVTSIIGDVKGRDIVLTDDLCSTAGTLTAAAAACKKAGAGRVVAAVSHGLFVGEALKKIMDSPLEAVLVADTVPGVSELAKSHQKIRPASVAGLMGEAIGRILSDRSISSLFV